MQSYGSDTETKEYHYTSVAEETKKEEKREEKKEERVTIEEVEEEEEERREYNVKVEVSHQLLIIHYSFNHL